MSTETKHPRDLVDQERLAGTLMDLIDVPSPTGEEQALAEFMNERFRDMGLRSWLQEVEPGESNVVASLEGRGGGATLLFVGHLDTTWSGAEESIRDLGPGYQPIATRDGDWIYGMGADNMKSGIAIAMEAVRALVDSGVELLGDIVIAGVVGESPKAQVPRYEGMAFRGAGKGARHLVTNGVIADFCVVPEATSGHISAASGGYAYLEISTTCDPGSTYIATFIDDPERELDAVERMNLVLDHAGKWGREYVARPSAGSDVPTHYAVTAIDGGLAYRPSKKASLCRAMVEIGLRPGQCVVDVVEEFKGVVRAGPVEDVSVRVMQAAPGAAVNPDELIVRAIGEAHAVEFGEHPTISSDGWLADTSHLTRYGIPSVCYGTAGMTQDTGPAKMNGERCYLPDLTRGARVLANLAVDLGSLSRDRLPAAPAARGTVVL